MDWTEDGEVEEDERGGDLTPGDRPAVEVGIPDRTTAPTEADLGDATRDPAFLGNRPALLGRGLAPPSGKLDKSLTLELLPLETSLTLELLPLETSFNLELLPLDKSLTLELLPLDKLFTLELLPLDTLFTLELLPLDKSFTLELLPLEAKLLALE